MIRMVKLLVGVGVCVVGLAVGTAGVASASEQSYLRVLDENGMQYVGSGLFTNPAGIASPAEALRGGRMVCDNIRYSGDPRAGFNTLTNLSIPDYLIDAAQHELCPDTL